MHRITILLVVVFALLLSVPLAAGDAPAERTGIVKRGETPMTLLGTAVAVGDKAPSPPLWGPKLEEVNIDFADGTTRVVLFVPSVDTPTCSMQTRTFNTRAPEAGQGAEVIVISRDLPYAQSRFCAANGIEMVFPRSDYRTGGCS
ncbi:MAG: redoxin domain-containing protein [Proteobacteria bacterium]|nr:redoxin domain-containing protein [Pseudomonadota bacterium]